MNNQVSRDANRLKESQSELTEYRNNLSSLTAQIEALRSNKDYLERQLADVEDRYTIKIAKITSNDLSTNLFYEIFHRAFYFKPFQYVLKLIFLLNFA